MADEYDDYGNTATYSPPETKKEKKEDFSPADQDANTGKVSGILYYGIFQLLLGVGTIGALIPLFSNWDKYSTIKSPLSEGGSPFAFHLNLPLFIIGTAVLLLLSGAVAIVARRANSKKIGWVAIFIAIVGAAVQIYAAVEIKTTLDTLRVKLEGNPVSDTTFTDAEKSVMDFSSAVFNTCCLSEYDSRNYSFPDGSRAPIIRDGQVLDDNQRLVPECDFSTTDQSVTCPVTGENRMFPEIIEQISGVGSLTNVLCMCYSVKSDFDTYVDILKRDNLCEAYRNIVIEGVDDIEVPTIGLTFNKVVSLLGTIRPEYKDQLPMGEFAFVGKMLPPAQIYNEPAEDIGWSCGLGYAKADMFYMYLFIEGKTKVPIIGGLALGALSAVSSLLLAIYWATGGGSEEDEDMMEYGDFEEQQMMSANKPKKDISV